jgi:anti-anti-sigma factor
VSISRLPASDRGVYGLILDGDIDIVTVPELRLAINAAVDDQAGSEVLLDMSAVTFLDSTGLGMLVGSYRRAARFGGSVVVVNPSGRVRKVLVVTGLASMLLAPD